MSDWSTAMEQAVRDTVRARVWGAWAKGFLVGVVVGIVLVVVNL